MKLSTRVFKIRKAFTDGNDRLSSGLTKTAFPHFTAATSQSYLTLPERHAAGLCGSFLHYRPFSIQCLSLNW